MLALTVLAVAAASLLSGSREARADALYIGGSGIGFSFGTGGYRGGYFGGPIGFYGPPYRPYGAPYYYHPYDRRAYPYRQRLYPNRSRAYVAPPRYQGQPQRVPYTKTGLAPFTPAWYAYCSRKFKSFNPNTGTYLAYSGKYRFCR
ncbi:BA14K family protein [Rhodobacterales bacterium]|nr:BA14K family protein [Rhodobacterales bacterium]